MADYRCYLLDGAGAIRYGAALACADDGAALAAARRLLKDRTEYHGFELWQATRRVHVEEKELL